MPQDAVKFDNCGSSQNMSEYARLLNASGRRVQIENCHNPVWHASPAFPAGHGDKNPFFAPGSDPNDCPVAPGAGFLFLRAALYFLVLYRLPKKEETHTEKMSPASMAR
jgi:hypothetical protein